MHFMWFTERAYHYDPEVDPAKYHALENQIVGLRSFYNTPNRFFEREHGAKLLNQYLDEKIYTDAELKNFDGVMLNEHHGTPFCMGAVMDVEAAVLARCTRKVKIVLLGNPLPVAANPLRLAEELAMIDLISGGRLVPGWVRGAGSEQLANNVNPAYNREYFEEAHDLVIAAWTRPGPFRWEGKHFNFRFVNPWVLPLQKPHPPIWIPGLISPETVRWCAEHRYPYVALATMLEPTLEMWKMYTDRAAEMGYQAGPENFGYLQPVFVHETEEKADEMGRHFLYGGGFSHFARPEWMFPPGYNSKAATRRLSSLYANPNTPGLSFVSQDHTEDLNALRKRIQAAYEGSKESLQMIAGTPRTVIPKLKKVLSVLRPGIFSFWLDGPAPAKDRMTCLRLLGTEVIPQLREIGRELGLDGPFEREPGSVPLGPTGKPEYVGSMEGLGA
jgi:alkanesulfonate monooxygenase SsuD/methylene tetrahydromethanopterin reductase-like flavin-dependent oxidoreductase (luciferase family)